MVGLEADLVVEPRMPRGTSHDQLSQLLRAHQHAIHVDIGELCGRDFIDPPVQVDQLAVGAIDGAGGGDDFALGDLGIELRDLVLDGLDRCLKLPHALAVAGEQRHCEGSYFLRDLVAQHLERPLTAGGDEHASALGEIVADDVGDGVGLAGTWWTLNGDARRTLQVLNDGHLFVVVGKREVELFLSLADVGHSAAGQPSETHGLVFDRLVRRRRHDTQHLTPMSAASKTKQSHCLVIDA